MYWSRSGVRVPDEMPNMRTMWTDLNLKTSDAYCGYIDHHNEHSVFRSFELDFCTQSFFFDHTPCQIPYVEYDEVLELGESGIYFYSEFNYH